jgi:hypothetical protein
MCEMPQQFKVNFTMAHGTCEFHRAACQENSHVCRHCNNFIVITQVKPPDFCAVCRKKNFTVEILCGHQACFVCASSTTSCSSCEMNLNKCEKCEDKNDIVRLPCTHKICKKCIKSYKDCPKCSQMCSDCSSTDHCTTLRCGHIKCEKCLKVSNKCNSCPDTCEDCRSNILWDMLQCKHRICEECRRKVSGGGCPICVVIKRRMPQVAAKSCCDPI